MQETALSDIAIKVERASKRFKLYHNVVTGPVKELLVFWNRKRFYEEFMAVRDVSLEVRRGEVLGIIGANGAGKTTLLKMIAGLLPVDRGRIEVNGTITALLALGVGIHPEFTGRDNILYGGMLLGMSKREVQKKMPSIIEFAELGDFIDRPFRTYSAGMRARLLFSTAMSCEPDILIVDEALSTGDYYFMQKCEQRFREMCTSGATVLFVSHNYQTVESLCRRTVVMDQGQVVFDGPSSEAINFHIDSVHRRQAQRLAASGSPQSSALGTGEVRLRDVYLRVGGQRTNTAVIGRPCEICLEVEAARDLECVRAVLKLFSAKAPTIYAYLPPADPVLSIPADACSFALPAGVSTIVMAFDKLAIGDGTYSCDVILRPGNPDYRFSYDTCYCFHPRYFQFQAIYDDHRYFGRNALTEIPLSGVRVER